MTDREWTGVWVSDRPLLEAARFGDNAVIFEIEVADEALADCEWIEDGKGYREWLVPAAVLNGSARRRVEDADKRHANPSSCVSAEPPMTE